MRASLASRVAFLLALFGVCAARGGVQDLTRDMIVDREFGPWRGATTLPANVLPDDAGADGVPEWPYLGGWEVSGPHPASDWMHDKPTPAAHATQWQALDPENGTGMLYLAGGYHEEPDRKSRPTTMPAEAVFWAKTSLTAPRDMELYFAAGVDGRLTIWINGQRVAGGPRRLDPDSAEEILLFKAPLRKGPNAMLVCLHANDRRGKFRVSLPVRGKPRPPGRMPSEPVAPITQSIGYRGHGTGRYPSTHPVTAWDVQRGINVAWRTPLLWSKAQPVIAGDRIFLTEEPQTLTCLDKNTGKVLWRREVDVVAMVHPELTEQGAELKRAALAAHEELLRLGAAPWQRVARFEAQGVPTTQAVEKARQARQHALRPHDRWVDFVRISGECVMPLAYRKPDLAPGAGSPWTGFSFATPVTDGRHVWVHFFTGATACFDLDGRQKWVVRRNPVQSSGSECSSPVLVDGLLIQQYLHKQPHRLWMRMDRAWWLALDAATGREVWRTDVLDFRSNSTPAVVRLKLADQPLTLLVSGSGTVVRARDGKVLIPRLLGNDGYSSPVVDGDTVYRIGEGPFTAHRLFMYDAQHVGAQQLWARHNPEEHAGGLVLGGGCLFGLQGAERCKGLRVYNAATGHRLDRRANRDADFVGVLRFQTVWTPPAVGGDYVFLCDRGTSSARYVDEWAHVSVMQAHSEGRFVAHNRIDTHLDAPPVIDGDRLYLRTDEALTCLARTTAEGERYEAIENARELLADLPASPPPRRQAVAVPAHAGAPATRPAPFAFGRQRLIDAAWTGADGQAIPREQVRRAFAPFERSMLMDASRLGAAEAQCALRSDRPRTVRVTLPGAVQAAVNGRALENHGRATLPASELTLTVKVPAGSSGPVYVRFEPSDDQELEARQWRDDLERCRPILERVVARAPRSPEARQAATVLKQAGR